MIETEVQVDGPFSKHHWLVKVGAGFVLCAFVFFANYLPLSLAVWLIFVGAWQPTQVPPSVGAWLFAGALLLGMICLGAYCIVKFIDWMTSGRLYREQLAVIVAALCCISIVVSIAAVLLEHWESVFLGAVIGTFLGLMLGSIFTTIGQALSPRKAGPS